ncbi:hypothetical protein QN326_04590 [Candidatus Phytoplasma asteris]|uniref:Uncharacterized protein n=1 Tax=Candidatus Phytoplasma asteris TaxID=85620 RepID=A0ABZ3CDN8_9MOLU
MKTYFSIVLFILANKYLLQYFVLFCEKAQISQNFYKKNKNNTF